MKKRYFLIISILSVIFVASIFSSSAIVFAQTSVSTEIKIPSSYVEYFDLVCPVDIDFGNEKFAILENDEHAISNNRLIVNQNDEYIVYDFSAYDATEIRFFNEYILFLSNSRIYIFDFETRAASDTGMVAATSFSVLGNVVLTNTSSGLDVYSADDEDFPAFTRSYSVSLPNSPETVVLFGDNSAYYFSNKEIYAYNLRSRTGEKIKEFSGDALYSIRSDKSVYFSASDGIYCLNENFELSQINKTPSSSVQGIAINDGRLFACYKDDGAVNEVSLNSDNPFVDNFTLFAVTYDGDRINRLSSDAKATEYENGLVYTLDGNKIKYADLDKGAYYEYDLSSFIGAGSAVSDFAIDKKTLLFIETLPGGDTKLHLLSVDGTPSEIGVFSDHASVTDLFAYEGEYYFINNKTNVSRQYAEVNRLYGTDEGYSSEVVFSPQGTGWALYIDVFGEIYVSALVDGRNALISSERGELFENARTILSPFVDFDGNVYYFTEGDAIYRYDCDEDSTETFTPSLWVNAPNEAKIVDLVPAENGSFYLLYNGFILKTKSGMNVATPDEIAVPEDFSIDFNDAPELVSLKRNGKLFAVSLADTTGENFDYLGYKTYSQENDLVVVAAFSKYTLVADEDGSYVARTVDVATRTPAEVSPVGKSLFITNDAHGYALPVLDLPYATVSLNKNENVAVEKNLSFNGVDYSLINADGARCYIPSAFLKPAVADAASYKIYKKSTVGQKGAKVFIDSNLNNSIGSLEYGAKVFIVEEADGVTKILYGNDVAYIRSGDLSTRTHYAIRNLLVILVLFVAILSSVFFILHTRVFKKKS